MSRSHASAATTGDQVIDTESQAFVLERYLASQTVTERLAFPESATPPQAKAHDTAEWVDEWQAAWKKLAKA